MIKNKINCAYQATVRWLFLSIILLSNICYADQLVIEPDMGRTPVLQALNNTQQHIQLVMYGFTDQTVLQSLIQQKLKNKTIQIILESKPYKAEEQNNKTISTFRQYQINWQGKVPPFRFIHQKTLLLDNQKAMVMTFNFTQSAFKNQRNFALILDDKKMLKEITNVFSADFNHQPISPNEPNLVWSPDNSREKILNLIQNAKQSIRIYAQDINDFKIVGALAKAAKKGISVKIICAKSMRDKQENYLTRAGVKIVVSKLYIHAKVMIIDNAKALVGSINFTRASLDDNRELSVITQDKNVIKQLSNTFEKDWRNDGNKNNFKTNYMAEIKHYLPKKTTVKKWMRQFDRYMHQHI